MIEAAAHGRTHVPIVTAVSAIMDVLAVMPAAASVMVIKIAVTFCKAASRADKTVPASMSASPCAGIDLRQSEPKHDSRADSESFPKNIQAFHAKMPLPLSRALSRSDQVKSSAAAIK